MKAIYPTSNLTWSWFSCHQRVEYDLILTPIIKPLFI